MGNCRDKRSYKEAYKEFMEEKYYIKGNVSGLFNKFIYDYFPRSAAPSLFEPVGIFEILT